MAAPGKSAPRRRILPNATKRPTKRDLSAFDFNFDARAKPITEKMLQLEAKNQKGFLSKKTKFPIIDIVVLLEQKTSIKGLTRPLAECVLFYKKNERDGAQFLEALGRLILEAASKERVDQPYQQYLLYQALDTFSMAIQHSEKRVNAQVASLMVSTFKVLSPINSSAYHIEKEIHKSMVELAKDPNDLEPRDKIIKLCMKGKRYYEALYQIVEYDKIMKLKSRSMYAMKAGEIQFRMATVFQHMIDFYVGVTAGEAQKNVVGDMGKLTSFIKRFNLDNSRFKIIPLADQGPIAIIKTLGSLITVANTYYNGAAQNNRFAYRHKAYYCMAYNYVSTDKVKAAINNIISGIEALAKSNLRSIEKGNEKIQLLEFIIKTYNEHSMSRKAEGYAKELQALRANVRQMESQKRVEEEKRKEALGES